MELNKSYWLVTAEKLFKAEYDIPDIPVKDMQPAEFERVRQFYGKYSEPAEVYMELGSRIVALANRRQRYEGAYDAYQLMYEAYRHDASTKTHEALSALAFTYSLLASPDAE